MPNPRRRPVTAASASVAALAGFLGVLAVVVTGRADRFDLRFARRLQERRPRSLDPVIDAASWPGFAPQSRIIPSLMIATWFLARRRRAAAFLAAAWGSAALSTVIKLFVRRPRPLPAEVRVSFRTVSGTSFPSGHVLTYTGFYGFLAYLLGRAGRAPGGRIAAFGLLGLIGLVGPSRIHQGHHWPTDVLSSYLLGLAYTLGLIAAYESTSKR